MGGDRLDEWCCRQLVIREQRACAASDQIRQAPYRAGPDRSRDVEKR